MSLITLSLAGLLTLVTASEPASSPGSKVHAQDALVLVEGHSPAGGVALGCGVVTGDGSWVVCPHCIVQETSSVGRHSLARVIRVISPYLGQTALPRVEYSDTEQGLALVQVPWKGHPALALADPNRVIEANEVMLVSMPFLLGDIPKEVVSVPESNGLFSECRLPVDYVTLRKGVPQWVVALGQGHLQPGSTGPLLSTAGSQVLALTWELGSNYEWLQGRCVHTLRSHLHEQTPGPSDATPAGLQRASDGLDVLRRRALWSLQANAHQYEAALDTARTLQLLRPQQVEGYLLGAEAADGLRRFDQAETLYKQAIERSAEPIVKIRCMRFLQRQGRLKEARAILDTLWGEQDLRPFLSGDVYRVLKGQPDLCLDYLNQSIQVNPNCAHTWLAIGQCRSHMGQHGAAAEAASKAVELYPEDEDTRYALLDLLHRAGRFEKMEQQHH